MVKYLYISVTKLGIIQGLQQKNSTSLWFLKPQLYLRKDSRDTQGAQFLNYDKNQWPLGRGVRKIRILKLMIWIHSYHSPVASKSPNLPTRNSYIKILDFMAWDQYVQLARTNATQCICIYYRQTLRWWLTQDISTCDIKLLAHAIWRLKEKSSKKIMSNS